MNRKRHLAIVIIAAIVVPLSILFGTMACSESPVIESMEAESDRVSPLGSTQIVCTASSPDGYELSYEWSATGGQIHGEGATATWTAPDEEGEFRIEVTVADGRDGEDTHGIIVTVKDNQPPVISSLTADAEWTYPAGIIEVECQAYDPDDDDLSYEWSASEGDIHGTGTAINWTAPEEFGAYHITVAVDDGYGGSVTETLSVKVMPDQAPDIERLEVSKDRHGHCYLRDDEWGIRIGQGQKYDIECLVSDTVPATTMERFYGLSYEWEWDYGDQVEISEDGSMLTWVAPNRSVDVTITVTISDIAGNTASESITMRVVACSPCTFGRCP